MTMFDLKNSIDLVQSLPPLDYATAVNGTGADLQGFEAAVVAFSFGALTAGPGSVDIEEGDTLGGAYTSVAAADLIGTIPAVAANTAGRVGYKGTRRFIRAVTVGTATIRLASADVIRGRPSLSPIA